MRWIVLISLVSAACGRSSAAPRPTPDAAVAPLPPIAGYSNIYAQDYVGPARCGECHEENFGHWKDSLHSKMNQEPAGIWAEAKGALAYAGGTMTFADGVMTTVSARGEERRFRVTRTIGSRYLQEYVGVQEQGPEAADHAIYRTELRLPFGVWRRAGGWVPRQYFDSWYPAEELAGDAYRPDDEPWATRCAWCHNTYPFEIRAVRATDGELGHGLEQFYDLAVERRAAPARAAIAQSNLLPVDELVTVGISCESCHLGGREHTDHEEDLSFTPRSSDLRLHADAPDLSGGRDSAVVVDAICAQCHSTPSPRWPNQAAQRNSTEALDMAAGACAPAIACTDCHDPHVAGPGPGAPDQAKHVAACTGCHPGYADKKHTRHDGVSCLDCHMPRIVQGVSAVVRTHRISSPGDDEMLTLDTPNACNLCHLDRSLTWTMAQLDAGWDRWPGKVEDPGGGDALGPRWLRAGGAMRITAAAAYARAHDSSQLPLMLDELDAPVAYDRMWMLFAIQDLAGKVDYDPLAAPAVRKAQAETLRGVLPTP